MFKLFGFKRKESRPSVLRNLLKDPDGHIFTMEVEDGEVVIRIRRKEQKDVQ